MIPSSSLCSCFLPRATAQLALHAGFPPSSPFLPLLSCLTPCRKELPRSGPSVPSASRVRPGTRCSKEGTWRGGGRGAPGVLAASFCAGHVLQGGDLDDVGGGRAGNVRGVAGAARAGSALALGRQRRRRGDADDGCGDLGGFAVRSQPII